VFSFPCPLQYKLIPYIAQRMRATPPKMIGPSWGLLSLLLLTACTVGTLTLAQTCVAPDTLAFTSQSGALQVNGQPLLLKGVSWFGFETGNNVVHGLWANSMDFYLDFMANASFNAIRLPFYLGLAINDASPNSINYNVNANLQGLTSLQIMDLVVKGAAQRGMLIMFDLHSFNADSYASDGLWYNSQYPEAAVIAGWSGLLRRYASQWNVIAADLKNEPFSATWATGNNATDWNAGAARVADGIAATVSSRFLIFVEGVANSPPCSDACFYGEDLMGVATAPVVLQNPEKLVYSPHVYGPSVYGQPYFTAPNFPANMPAIWNAHWAFIPARTGNAIVVGEWGGPTSGADGVWLDAFASFLVSTGLTDQFFWCLNPNSGDTGGLLEDDWTTPVADKLALLASIVSVPTRFVLDRNSGQVCFGAATNGTVTPSPSALPPTPSASASAAPSPIVTPAPPSASPTPAPLTCWCPCQCASPSPSSSPAAAPSFSPTATALPSPSVGVTPSPSANAPSMSPPPSGVSFYAGSSAWWMGVTIPGSTAVEVDCGNGQGYVAMTAGWSPHLWVFSSTNGHPCASTVRFLVNGSTVPVVVTAPW